MKPLTDADPMPFGKYKGTAMMSVPASYLHHLWHNGVRGTATLVADYIRENRLSLEHETPNLVWEWE